MDNKYKGQTCNHPKATTLQSPTPGSIIVYGDVCLKMSKTDPYRLFKKALSKICIFLGYLFYWVVTQEKEMRRDKEKHTAASSGLSKPLILLDCENVSLFFNQWKLNYPDSWGTLKYINSL